jgi:hypothetical protein
VVRGCRLAGCYDSALGHAIEMHEHGDVPVAALVALGTLCVLTVGLLLICCLTWSSSSSSAASSAAASAKAARQVAQMKVAVD